MKAKRKPATKAKNRIGRLSRTALNRELIELTARAARHEELAEALAAVNAPNGQHTVSEHQLRTVFGVQLEALRQSASNVSGFAKIVCDAATRVS
jgi:hypothetical protein